MATFAVLAIVILAGCEKQRPDAKPADVDYYTCTMHPSVRSQEPGKCPICSMDLVPVMKKAAAGMTATNAVGPANNIGDNEKTEEFIVPMLRQQQIGVSYATVEKRSFTNTIRTVGTVAYDKQRHWDYVARVDGYVQKLFVFSRGELVEKDAPLVTLYSPDLLTTENELLDLLKTSDANQTKENPAVVQSTKGLIESAKQRLRLLNINDQQIQDLEKSRQAQEYLTLYSPFKGVVQNIGVDQGRKVANGDHLVDVADLSVVWVWAQFYQDDLPMIKKGLSASVTTTSYPGEKFDGKIIVVDPFMNDAMRTFRVRIDVENPDFKLRPDMYMDVELTIDAGEGIAVPASAVLPTGRHNIVFIDKGEGRLEPRYLELGRRYGEFYEVRSGVKEHERVVASGNFLIDAEANVQGALKFW